MFEFAWWWMLALLPLPLLVRYLLKPISNQGAAALKASFINDFTVAQNKSILGLNIARPVLLGLAAIAWVLLVTASARPQYVDEIQDIQISGRDLMLAIDISGSMKTADFSLRGRRVNRLEAAQAVATDFIERRKGDRIGLIVFGTEPYLQMPLSFDLKTVQEMLNNTFIGLAGKDSTAIGDAIGLSIKRLRGYKQSNRILILLTDGINNAGNLNPIDASDIAKQENMKIYTIGIGSSKKRGFFSRRPELDEATLKSIAKKTGGRYFRAKNTNELIEIYQILDKLEEIEREQKTVRLYSELYPYPLAVACIIALLILFAITLPRKLLWIS